MSPIQRARLSFRMLRRDLRAGELNVLLLALLIAIAAVTSVGFFTDRVERGLASRANELLGADLVISSDHPMAPEYTSKAAALGLQMAFTTTFPSMVLHGDATQLASIKAVSGPYPLRGRLSLGARPAISQVQGAPRPGEVWADDRLLGRLGIQPGAQLEVGDTRLRLASRIDREPDAAADVFNIMPRVILNADDLARTGLIQNGSRVRYRLLLAGPEPAIDAYRRFAEPLMARGERLETVQDARPEVRNALERAHRFLGLAALASVALACVAIGLATRRYVERHLDPVAMMRCLGASQSEIFQLFLWQFAVLALGAGLAGVALGYVAQQVLVSSLASLVDSELPASHWLPGVQGWLLGSLLLFGFAVPPLLRLRLVSTLRVLRREIDADIGSRTMYLAGGSVLAALLMWQAGEARLAAYVLGGFALGIVLAAGVGWVLMLGLRRFNRRSGITWRFGIANLYRRKGLSILQIVALSLGLMALLTLTLVRADLLRSWQQSVPPDAPNRFVINIQPQQQAGLAAFFTRHELKAPEAFPMIRGRWVALNGQDVKLERYLDERARNLAEREFNLSWAEHMQHDNRIVAGQFWAAGDTHPQFSVEEGLAKTLGIKLGDRLTFDIAGVRYEATVTSLRKVNWDSFNVNFFVVATGSMLKAQPTSYVSSFYLPEARQDLVNELVRAYPNLTVVDVGAVLAEVRGIIDKVVGAVEFVFLFTVAAGLVVLHAALASTQDERRLDNAVLRTLGASRRQLLQTALAEFAVIGALAGGVAVIGSAGLGWAVSVKLLSLPYQPDWRLPLFGIVGGALAVVLAGLPSLLRLTRTPPLRVLNQTG
ncbi:FtsX-like permease family protein [Chitinivorax sp. PXF-14]|uniref:ABC transporter permease n=1 Tax=Chitinivorax sp. PXF-14 TaxID=3230488 RepID=UPI003465FC5A